MTEQGARVPLRLAFDDDFNGASGKFFAGVTSADTGPGESEFPSSIKPYLCFVADLSSLRGLARAPNQL